jgi:hypothetical protein
MSDRRTQIEAAIGELRLLPAADVHFFVRMVIEPMLDHKEHVVIVRPPRPKDGAAALRDLAQAIRDALMAVDSIIANKPAFEALNAERERRGIEWKTVNRRWSFLSSNELAELLDVMFPRLVEVAEQAATTLDGQVAATRPKGRDEYRLTVARTLASAYNALTGEPPAISRSDASPFVQFVSAIFAAADIKGSAAH